MPRLIPSPRLYALVFCLGMGSLAPVLWAQTATWRKQHDRGNRYEGRIDIPVGKPDLELLAFMGYRESFTTDVTLKVRFFLPTAVPVFIQGRELQEQKQYWMEAKPTAWTAGAWNEFGPWPTREVLGKEGIPAWNVGVVIRLDSASAESGVLAPAFVYHTALPASMTTYLLHLRPNATLTKVTASLYTVVNEQEVAVQTVSVGGDKIAGEPFVIPLDAHALAALKKPSEIDVHLKVSQLSFTLGMPSPDSLFTAIMTRSLTLQNVHQVDLGPGRLEVPAALDPHTQEPDDWRTVRVSATTLLTVPDAFASVTLEDVALEQVRSAPGSRLTVSWLPQEPHALKLRIEGAEVTGSLVAGKTLRLSCSTCQVQGSAGEDHMATHQWRFTSAREHVITFSSRSTAPVMAFELPAGATLVERSIPLAEGIDFTQMEGRRRTSTVIGDDGTITFAELKKEVQIDAGDFVMLAHLTHGFLKTLAIDNGIVLALHGRVGTLATGPAAFLKDRLPSWLEWLYARETWLLSLQALVLVSTTAWAVLKRFKLVQEE